MLLFAVVLALIWGGVWALFLQRHPLGRFLAIKRTWITVVIGVGMDMVIALLVVDWKTWLIVMLIIAVSSIGIIYRSLYNELRYEVGVLDDIIKTECGQQTVGEQSHLGTGGHRCAL